MKRIQSAALMVVVVVAGCAGSNEPSSSEMQNIAFNVQDQIAYYDSCLNSVADHGVVDSASDCAARTRGLASQIVVDNSRLGSDDDVVVRWTVRNDGKETAWLPRW